MNKRPVRRILASAADKSEVGLVSEVGGTGVIASVIGWSVVIMSSDLESSDSWSSDLEPSDFEIASSAQSSGTSPNHAKTDRHGAIGPAIGNGNSSKTAESPAAAHGFQNDRILGRV